MRKKKREVLGALDPNQPKDSHLLKLCEILFRANALLNALDTFDFNDFYVLYNRDVGAGYELLSKCVKCLIGQRPDSIESLYELLSTKLNQKAYKPQHGTNHAIFNLSEEPQQKLSVLHQSELLVARWNVYCWIRVNTEAVTWLYRRREIYPLVLGIYAATQIAVDQDTVVMLPPTIRIEWLVDLVYRCLRSNTKDRDIAEVISNPENHSRVMNFSAQISSINKNLTFIQSLVNTQITQALNFFFANIPFFNGLLGAAGIFRPQFNDYLRANFAAVETVSKLSGYRRKLVELCQEEAFGALVNNPQKLEQYASVFKVLVEGVITGRFALWLELSNITQNAPEDEQARRVMGVAAWLEKYRSVIGLTFDPHGDWAKWISLQNQDRDLVLCFTQSVSLSLDLVSDVRPIKSTGEWQNFPNPHACFMDCFRGLPLEEINAEVSCGAKDVQLYKFLRTLLNFRFVICIEQYRDDLTRIFEAFLMEQNIPAQQLMALALGDASQQGDQVVARVEAEVPQILARRPTVRGLEREFEESNRAGGSGPFSMRSQ